MSRRVGSDSAEKVRSSEEWFTIRLSVAREGQKGNRWLADVPTECAWAAATSRDTYLAAQYWRLARRIGKKKATMAVATRSW
jgi:hypothetical protein